MIEKNNSEYLKDSVKNLISSGRMQHSLQTAETAETLACKFGVSSEKAYRAGLLHDICRDISFSEMKNWLEDSSWDADVWEKKIPNLLHAPASAARAERELGIHDLEVLQAIRYHATGYPDMDDLTSVVFLADKIEPGRQYRGCGKIRREVENGLKPALLSLCNRTLKYLIQEELPVHPRTFLLRNQLLEERKINE